MKKKLLACLELMRVDRPVGTVLLACPMLWALWLAGDGKPAASIVFIFLLGAFVMRSAGCVINDFADRHFDRNVERTKMRPLTSGRLSVRDAIILFVILILVALSLLSFLPKSAFPSACLSLLLACLYPFTKRFFKIPQLVLGMSYSCSVLMAYMTVLQKMPANGWLLFVAVTLWTIVYDTYYAMVDRKDDVDIGINSSALWFGDKDLALNRAMTVLFVILMVFVGVFNSLNFFYFLGLFFACLCFFYQMIITKDRHREACFTAFLNNQWVGVLIFMGVLMAYL